MMAKFDFNLFKFLLTIIIRSGISVAIKLAVEVVAGHQHL